MEAKLLGNNSEAYGPTHTGTKLKEYFKGYIKFCQQEGKSYVVILNSSASKLLHEVHLESEKKDKKIKENSHSDSCKTQLVRYHITEYY